MGGTLLFEQQQNRIIRILLPLFILTQNHTQQQKHADKKGKSACPFPFCYYLPKPVFLHTWYLLFFLFFGLGHHRFKIQ